MRIIVHVLFALTLAASPVRAADAECPRHLPRGIQASADLRQHMQRMLERSATFRQQCQRLDVPDLSVYIRLDMQLLDKPYRAQTTITRTLNGRVVASVTITAFGDPTEWLAHELEHVIEQLDDVRIRQRVAAGDGGIWEVVDGMFETARAVHAGRVVRQEVHDTARTVARMAKTMDAGRGDD